jgi:hypothetical protein
MARTLDKTVNDRKHLSGREFERLLEAVRGSRNEVRDRCLGACRTFPQAQPPFPPVSWG